MMFEKFVCWPLALKMDLVRMIRLFVNSALMMIMCQFMCAFGKLISQFRSCMSKFAVSYFRVRIEDACIYLRN